MSKKELYVAVVLLLLLSMQFAQAKVIIYDSFDHTGDLNGSSPDIGSGIWSAGDDMSTDGSVLKAGVDTDWQGRTANLAFTPQGGYVYTLSAVVDIDIVDAWWSAIGFITNEAAYAGNVMFYDVAPNGSAPAPWILLEGDGTIQSFSGPATAGGSAYEDGSAGRTGAVLLEVILDTTAEAWTYETYADGVLTASGTYVTNPVITAIGLGTLSTTAAYDDFTLEVSGKTHPDAPVHNGINIDINQDLSWDVIDFNVTHVDLYFGVENEPNLILDPESVGYKKLSHVDATAITSYEPGILNYNTTYYWRVDAYEPNGMGEILIPGTVNVFTTVAEDPVLSVVSPAFIAVDAGEPSVVMSVSGVNIDSYQWYKVGDPDVALSDGADYAGAMTDTLTINDVVLADEGYYYCIGTNTAGSDTSDSGRLMTRRLTSYYPLEVINAVPDGNSISPDTADGFDMFMLSDDAGADVPVLASGVSELAPDEFSLLFDNSDVAEPNNHWGQYAQIDSGVASYEDITISVWAYWNGGGAWQRILDCSNSTEQTMYLTPSDGGQCRFQITANGISQSLLSPILPVGEWTYLTVTLNGDTGRVYVNGELEATNTGFSHNPIDFSPKINYLGKSQFPDPFLNGQIDDLKIYNYARTTEQIAQDYLDIKGDWVCNNELPALEYDYNDNCRIDLGDFALFAATWLNGNRIYPD